MIEVVPSLSLRQAQMIRLASQGKTDAQIAAELEISIHSVYTYWKRLKAKYGVTSRSQLIWLASQHENTITKSEGSYRDTLDDHKTPLLIENEDGEVVQISRALRNLLFSSRNRRLDCRLATDIFACLLDRADREQLRTKLASLSPFDSIIIEVQAGTALLSISPVMSGEEMIGRIWKIEPKQEPNLQPVLDSICAHLMQFPIAKFDTRGNYLGGSTTFERRLLPQCKEAISIGDIFQRPAFERLHSFWNIAVTTNENVTLHIELDSDSFLCHLIPTVKDVSLVLLPYVIRVHTLLDPKAILGTTHLDLASA